MMYKVFCPLSGKLEWANDSQKVGKEAGAKDPICCKCGKPHSWRKEKE